MNERGGRVRRKKKKERKKEEEKKWCCRKTVKARAGTLSFLACNSLGLLSCESIYLRLYLLPWKTLAFGIRDECYAV
jgi:hypothetical protein